MNLWSSVLFFFTLVAVVLPILFEGQLKNENYIVSKNKILNSYKSLTKYGKALLFISASIVILNYYLTNKKVIEADNEIKKATELRNENLYNNFKNEVSINLANLLYNLTEENVNDKISKGYIPTIKLENTNINKYQEITNSNQIIQYLKLVSEDIKLSNSYLEIFSKLSYENINVLKDNARQYNTINDNIYHRLSVIYSKVCDIKNYKEFENTNLNIIPVVDKNALKEVLFKYVAIPYTGTKTIKELKEEYGKSAIIKELPN